MKKLILVLGMLSFSAFPSMVVSGIFKLDQSKSSKHKINPCFEHILVYYDGHDFSYQELYLSDDKIIPYSYANHFRAGKEIYKNTTHITKFDLTKHHIINTIWQKGILKRAEQISEFTFSSPETLVIKKTSFYKIDPVKFLVYNKKGNNPIYCIYKKENESLL